MNSPSTAPTSLILDLDTGIDDALAIAYALGSADARLIGITTTYGNVRTDQSVANSLAVLDLLGASDVPVFRGLTHARASDAFEVSEISAFIHGRNGLGNVDLPASKRTASEQSAVDFIIEASKNIDDLVYVPTGPLTNVAAAIDKDPSIVDRLTVVLMGGAVSVAGNVNAYAEANISQDPEAADLVFRCGLHTTVIGLDVTLQTLLTRHETQQWRDMGTRASTFCAEMTDYYITAYDTTAPDLGGCGLHDPLAVAVALDPSLVGTHAMNLRVDCDEPTRGRTIGDPSRLNSPVKTAKVALTVDADRFLAEFMNRVGSLVASR
ncbi:nucleoside hydrolase [Schaalia sp. ZJ405]|uniref:nucleoside hydrolase n=1 Tax=Schaalia sp. ZJ405 TaxID=2709403 RepID=UPI0013EA5AEE|nr:nucleoside hydrolase [Schaalia sp. ZJ405]QPK81567.1 nucleoside hydrolase [Schaalia sp. ZJ405]